MGGLGVGVNVEKRIKFNKFCLGLFLKPLLYLLLGLYSVAYSF